MPVPTARRWTRLALAAAAAAVALVGCAGGSSSDGTTSTTAASTASTDAGDPTTSGADGPTSSETPTTSPATTLTTAVPGLPDASEGQRTAPADGTGTALLSSVRIGRNEGFERIVFEFEGSARPGYRVQWVDPPITADGSGAPVEVEGSAFLEIILQPASGVDLSAPELRVVYEGEDRLTSGQAELIEELVRTGDFEAVLTWVAGTTERVPFRVLALSSPSRIVVDLETT